MKHSVFYKIILISTLFTAITKANYEEGGDEDDVPFFPYPYPDYIYSEPVADYITPQLKEMYPPPPPPIRRPITNSRLPPSSPGFHPANKNNVRPLPPPPRYIPQKNPVYFDDPRTKIPYPVQYTKDGNDDSLGGVNNILSKATGQLSGLINQ